LCVAGERILLTITEPARELLNWAFRIKMLLVLALAGMLWMVQLRMRQTRSIGPNRRRGATRPEPSA